MKIYAPKSLRGTDLRDLIQQLHGSPADIAKLLKVTERTVWRWLAEDSAPWPILALLWHETPTGREVAALDVGNDLVLTRAGKRLALDAQALATARLQRLLNISDTGAANDPYQNGPFAVNFDSDFSLAKTIKHGFPNAHQS
jgi:hypothetical protein